MPPPPVRAPNALPVCSAHRRPVPVHVLRRTIVPGVPLVRGRATRVTVREEAPRPAVTARVMPLWTAHAEMALRAEQARADELVRRRELALRAELARWQELARQQEQEQEREQARRQSLDAA
ncbi:hypothetical protein [Streptomyces sp. TLI_171]|uniref:hypothetical protein n=1 Tax=Streptomyces sp. TLI_171 TaxID=1938859 RepID=UPI000C56BCBC|nr:hypothetical protein [Streptomyces sp. TLI_171]RKE19823.1 hypothetical protein BX266_3154 [Streptomyces sp. TLI_171]